MMNNENRELKLRLSTLDCNTSTKYYQVTKALNESQINKIKTYFKYYTPDKFQNLENVAGKTTGWMCKSEDVEIVEELLEIKNTIRKQKANLEKIQRRTSNELTLNISQCELSFSK